MKLEKGYLYHIYNQGNNGRRVFFSRRNYLFFKEKLRTHITPYADILAWCLMPNHFHLMIYVKKVFIETEKSTNKAVYHKQSLNVSLGILLRSYTRAINNQEGFTGSLFRKYTKAKCLNCHEGISPNFYETLNGNKINIKDSTQEYPQVCFEYIHMNPVNAGLVSKMEDWEFSSAREYAGLSKKPLVCKESAREFINF